MATIANGAVAGTDQQNVLGVSANYTVQVADQFIQVTTGTSTITVTFPAPVAAGSFNAATQRPDQSTVGSTGNVGQTVTVQKVDTGNGTVICSGNFNIGVGYVLNNRWSQAKFLSDGVRWNLLGTVS